VDAQNLHKLCSDFVHFFSDLQKAQGTRPTGSSIPRLDRYPYVESALLTLKNFARSPIPICGQNIPPQTHIDESLRLVTLFYIAATWKDCLLSPRRYGDDLKNLDAALRSKMNMEAYGWNDSLANLYIIAVSGTGLALTNPLRSAFVIQLMDVARLLDLDLWMHIKERLCDILLGVPTDSSILMLRDRDLLYEHVRGRD
jgi:hypothetical protein